MKILLTRRLLMQQIHGESGVNFTLSRTHIGSCDFSVKGKYSYAEKPDDAELAAFSIAPDSARFWDMFFSVEQWNCSNKQINESYNACGTITVDGSDISFNDGSPDGPLAGQIDGDSATLVRTTDNGVFTIELQIDGDEINGSGLLNYTSNECASGGTTEYAIFGQRRSSACGTGSPGTFTGFWTTTAQWIDNGCGLPPTIDEGCHEVLQTGDTVYFVDEGFSGTVSGNTLTIQEEAFPVSFEIVITISNDGNSYTGTQTITLENPENPQESCTSTSSVSGTRVVECDTGTSGIGISLPERYR